MSVESILILVHFNYFFKFKNCFQIRPLFHVMRRIPDVALDFFIRNELDLVFLSLLCSFSLKCHIAEVRQVKNAVLC